MACLEIRRQSTHSRVIVIYRYRRGPGLASRVSPQPVLPAIVRSSPRAWAAALCHSHGGESAPRGPTPKRLCTRPWPSLVSGQLGHLLRVGGAPHRHRRGQARPGPRALAASSEGVSQPGHPTVRDIRLLTAECLWRTSRGQAQEAGLAVSVSGKFHFKTIQEKKKPIDNVSCRTTVGLRAGHSGSLCRERIPFSWLRALVPPAEVPGNATLPWGFATGTSDKPASRGSMRTPTEMVGAEGRGLRPALRDPPTPGCTDFQSIASWSRPLTALPSSPRRLLRPKGSAESLFCRRTPFGIRHTSAPAPTAWPLSRTSCSPSSPGRLPCQDTGL